MHKLYLITYQIRRKKIENIERKVFCICDACVWTLRTNQLRIISYQKYLIAIIFASKFPVKQTELFLKSLSEFSICLSLPRVYAGDENVQNKRMQMWAINKIGSC
jgi:hypothetical protein